jgi:hypothetical protein
MFATFKATEANELLKWCGFVLALLAPGSFVVLPLVWLGRCWLRRVKSKPLPGARVMAAGAAPLNIL